MVFVYKRSVIYSGGSYQFSIPVEWIRKHRISPGDEVTVIGNDVIVILPNHPIDKGSITKALDDAKTIACVSQSEMYPKPPNVLEDK